MPAMPVTKDVNIVKIAVEMINAPDKVPQLIEFDQRQPLAIKIQELCNFWSLPDPEQYALQFSESNNQNYITEKNRNEIKNGAVLRLEQSPAKAVQEILSKVNSGGPEERIAALEKLSKLSADITFACEFINKKGISLIINHIESGKFKGEALVFALLSFVELMDHSVISWDILESPFINKIASYVNNQSDKSQDKKVVQACLSILENIVLNSSGKSSQVEKEVTIPNLVMHLQTPTDVKESNDSVIQQNTISLINALFLKADNSKKKNIAATISSNRVRIIWANVIETSGKGTEMAHQLYVLQTLSLSLLEQRMMCKMDPKDPDAQDKIKELRTIAFENDNSFNADVCARRQLGGYAKDYKKLGFKFDINPVLDFTETPPGMLALDCMIYFARNHTEEYTKIVLENTCRADEHECPFGRTSVELVKLLCEILRIGETPSEQGETYHPMLFTHDHPFEEFFYICLILLNKTWKEMRATTEDFVKVFSVVREQITRALALFPTTFDKFKQSLHHLTYTEIMQIWKMERTNREESESHIRPIVELKEKITPEILELIKQQRLGFLVEGTRFTKYSLRGQRIKDKYWYVRLSPNHKVLHYGDCDEKSTPSLEELGNKLLVTDMKGLITGKECPHMKDVRGRKTTHQLAFSITLDSVDVTSLDFVAPEEQVFDYWTDGIQALLSNKMTSKTCKDDLETLLSMDIKLRLLDTEGIDIPQDPPPIPPEPDNYDFVFDPK